MAHHLFSLSVSAIVQKEYKARTLLANVSEDIGAC